MHRGTHSPRCTVSPGKQRSSGALANGARLSRGQSKCQDRWIKIFDSEVSAIACTPPPTSTRPVDPDVVPTHGVVILSEGSGDEVLRGEDVVAHKPVSANCPPPPRPGPASSCLVTAIDRTKL
jgi:hypothetical protein